MKRIRAFLQSFKKDTVDGQAKGASAKLAEELFYDLYTERRRIYKINFFRGIFFGAGSALGGTLVIALVVWLLSLFVNFPVIGEAFQDAQNSIERQTEKIESQR